MIMGVGRKAVTVACIFIQATLSRQHPVMPPTGRSGSARMGPWSLIQPGPESSTMRMMVRISA